jgi:predicted aconitase
MYLTREEEKMYEGEYGWAYEISMKILARLGDLFGASKLIPINSAHLSGVSYKTLGDAPIEFLQAIANAGGKVKVPSSLNPACIDTHYLPNRLPRKYCEKQCQVLRLYNQIGATSTLTCTPYYLHIPRKNSHHAWAESSAVIYANSVLSAWTNREGSPSALASALVGKTPEYGLHLSENRKPTVNVKIEAKLQNETEFGALGIHLGKLLKDEIPIFEGLGSYLNEDLKQLGAGLASSGMTSLFYPTGNATEKLETISVEAKAIKETIQNMSTTDKLPNLIFIGCPHCSIKEIKNIANFLKNKKIKKNMELWVCTSSYVKEKAQKWVNTIETAGGKVLCGTCAVVTWLKPLGIETLMTNSAKTAYYTPTLNKTEVTLAPLSQCLKTATNNRKI